MGRKVKRADLKVGTTWEADWNWRQIYEIRGLSAKGLPIDILWEDKFGPGICNHKTMLDWIRNNDAQMKKPQKEASPENPIFKEITGFSFFQHQSSVVTFINSVAWSEALSTVSYRPISSPKCLSIPV